MSTPPGATGTIRPIDITDTMQEAYLDYAMSVIVSRALPDVRDGLKPVHRRILYAMSHDLNLVFNRPHKKSARIVGEVLGKYHPHGDTAVYDAMVRMAQDFSLRYPLVDGQGNFGSIDGDNAAAMRYTEARLAEISDLMLADLEKETVEWHDNFDNSLLEPDILPAALPNLLINGASGIAVGMATNIPPHNMGEVVDALTFMIDRYDRLDEVSVEDLLHFIKGPDFPTGGILYRFREEKNDGDIDVVAQGYSAGKARLILQAKAHFEEMSRNRSRIVITELPYQTNKTTLIERIASLVRDGKIEGITDLRDESDRTGMRIVIELTRNVDPKAILADLFKYTPLQQTFGMQMLALVDGQPRLLGLKRMLHLFVQHREEIIRRRSEYDLQRARDRAHILEGLLKALDILDEVIATIRKSQRVETARTNLMRDFGFTQIQAQAILDMQLRRLAALERKRLQDEYTDLLKTIAYLEDLLAHPEKILALIKEDLLAIKEKYGDPRRTQIVDRTKGTLTSTDLLPEEEVWVSITANGELKRSNVGKLTRSSAQSKAKISQAALLQANTRDFLHVFASDGRSARVAIHEAPREQRKHLGEFTDFGRRDNVTSAIALPRVDQASTTGYLFLVTEKGTVKRVTMADFQAAAPLDPTVMNVDSTDKLAFAFVTQGDQEVILVSQSGKSIRFGEEDVRSMGLAAAGVGGMKLRKGERIIYAGVVDADGELMTATEKGYIKRSPLIDYSRQGRNGGGIVTHKPSSRTGKVSAATVLTVADLASPENWLAVVTAKGQAVMLTLSEVPQMGRGVQGKQLAQVGVGDQPCALRVVSEERGTGDDGTGDDGTGGSSPEDGQSTGNSAKKERARTKTVATPKKAPGRTPSSSTRKQPSASGPTGQATLELSLPAAEEKGPAKPKPRPRSTGGRAGSSGGVTGPSQAKGVSARSTSTQPATSAGAKRAPRSTRSNSPQAAGDASGASTKRGSTATTKSPAKRATGTTSSRLSRQSSASSSEESTAQARTQRADKETTTTATRERTPSSRQAADRARSESAPETTPAKAVTAPVKKGTVKGATAKTPGRATPGNGRSSSPKSASSRAGGVAKDSPTKRSAATVAPRKPTSKAASQSGTSQSRSGSSKSSVKRASDDSDNAKAAATAKTTKSVPKSVPKPVPKTSPATGSPKEPPTTPTRDDPPEAVAKPAATKPNTSKKTRKLQTVTTVKKKQDDSPKK